MSLDFLKKNSKFNDIYRELTRPGRIIHGLTASAKSFVLANMLSRAHKPIIFIVHSHHEAQTYYREISNLSKHIHGNPVFNFLCHEISPYDQINSDISVLNSEYEVFDAWLKGKPSLTVLNCKALSQLYLTKERFLNEALLINKEFEIDPLKMSETLVGLGYSRESSVEVRGQFSRRGDIIDIYPILGEAVRLEFFGDRIESIRIFSINSQRSIKAIESLKIHPRYLISRTLGDGLEAKIQDAIQKYSRQLSEDAKETLRILLSANLEDSALSRNELYWEGVEYYRSLLGQESATVFDFFPEGAQLIFDEWQDLSNIIEQWDTKLQEQYQEGLRNGKLIPLPQALHYSHANIVKHLRDFEYTLYIQSIVEPGHDKDLSYEILSYPAEKFASKIEQFVEYIKTKLKEKQQIIIYSEQPQRVLGILKEWEISADYSDTLAEESSLQVSIQRDGLEEGCKFPDFNLIMLTDRELFGRSRQTVARQKTAREDKSRKNIYTDISQIKPGDYVVHYKHGIGKYQGTEFVVLDGGRFRQEYIALEYADEARILIPLDQIHLLSRFNVTGDNKPRLSKLGGNEWERTKKKVQKSVRRIAQDLINLYAMREKQRGHKYLQDTPWQIEMEDAFPYTETNDQLRAVTEVKADMESEKLMDRLICGDAGFGKTEVIIRAVFKVIMEGKQAAILVPTTVLAQQHFNVFRDRYAPYPIRLGLLSRFKTAKEQRDVVQKLKIAECDLVIGTHRLLQKDIKFKDLGLLVIDEEQRFGVAHKEKLKAMRKDLNIISMSATPIPRTLHMALSGIKDISLISTPPTNRLPVKTFVGEYKHSIIRNAILHELERGGQVFLVHNRIETIERVASEIQDLIPEAHIRVAHGQTQPRDLEDAMFAFVNKEFDVLVCTTIIETGLDIANANTIIIDHANAFGLSQLYQLRGRVGRSDAQAYAYLLYHPEKDISETARKRLRAIREFTNLGSGYQIAIKDMEIRGVGNVFGAEQHGHMLAVGFDLYCKILNDAIEEMKGGPKASQELHEPCTVDLRVTALFPEYWLPDQKQRINEYKRLASVQEEAEIDELANEWQDRFGKLPPEAHLLTELARLRIKASKAGISGITEENNSVKLFTNMRLQQWLPMQRSLPDYLQGRLNFKAGTLGAKSAKAYISLNSFGLDLQVKMDAIKELVDKIKSLTN
jgi:transcription-repair coupling factor (superfamily II helicase)